MGWFSRKVKGAASADDVPVQSRNTHVGSPLKYVPSFNDFLGDNPGMELEADNQMQQQELTNAGKTQDNGAGAVFKSKGGFPPAANSGPPATKPGDDSPWRSVFDPGYNPNLHRFGRQYYDTVDDRKSEPSVWEYIIKAEQLHKGSFEEMDRAGKGYLVKEDLAAAFDGKYGDTGALVDQVDMNRDGVIDQEEFKIMVEFERGVVDVTSQGGVAWSE